MSRTSDKSFNPTRPPQPRVVTESPVSKQDERVNALQRSHDDDRTSELNTLKIPEAMRSKLFQAADKVLQAVNLADIEQARKKAEELGLRHTPLFDYLRGKDHAQQYDIAMKLINPNTLEIFGGSSFRHAAALRERAIAAGEAFGVPPGELETRRHEVAGGIEIARRAHARHGKLCSGDATGIPGADSFRRWNYLVAQGASVQKDALQKLVTEPPRTSYAQHVGQGGLDSLVWAIGKYEPTVKQKHFAMATRHSSEHGALRDTFVKEQRTAEVESSVRLAYARYRNEPHSVDPNFAKAVAKARVDPEHASPIIAKVISEVDAKAGRTTPERPPSSVVHYTGPEFRLMKELLDKGQSFAISDAGSFLRHYLYQKGTNAEVRAADGSPNESVLLSHSRAGLRKLVEEYRELGNDKALQALGSRVPMGLITPAEHRELFQISAKPAATEPKQVREDPFAFDAAAVERARHWSESLERFVSRQGKISRHDALQLAASLLTKRYKPEELQQIQSAARLDPRLGELAAVVARAEELITTGSRTAIG